MWGSPWATLPPKIAGVACALDATEANVRRALEAGANVLLTHHPV